MNDAVRPRAASRFDKLPELLPDLDGREFGTLTWAELYAPPVADGGDEVALAARLYRNADGALTLPVDGDVFEANTTQHDAVDEPHGERTASRVRTPAPSHALGDAIEMPPPHLANDVVQPAPGTPVPLTPPRSALPAEVPHAGTSLATSAPDAPVLDDAGVDAVAGQGNDRPAIRLAETQHAAQVHQIAAPVREHVDAGAEHLDAPAPPGEGERAAPAVLDAASHDLPPRVPSLAGERQPEGAHGAALADAVPTRVPASAPGATAAAVPPEAAVVQQNQVNRGRSDDARVASEHRAGARPPDGRIVLDAAEPHEERSDTPIVPLQRVQADSAHPASGAAPQIAPAPDDGGRSGEAARGADETANVSPAASSRAQPSGERRVDALARDVRSHVPRSAPESPDEEDPARSSAQAFSAAAPVEARAASATDAAPSPLAVTASFRDPSRGRAADEARVFASPPEPHAPSAESPIVPVQRAQAELVPAARPEPAAVSPDRASGDVSPDRAGGDVWANVPVRPAPSTERSSGEETVGSEPVSSQDGVRSEAATPSAARVEGLAEGQAGREVPIVSAPGGRGEIVASDAFADADAAPAPGSEMPPDRAIGARVSAYAHVHEPAAPGRPALDGAPIVPLQRVPIDAPPVAGIFGEPLADAPPQPAGSGRAPRLEPGARDANEGSTAPSTSAEPPSRSVDGIAPIVPLQRASADARSEFAAPIAARAGQPHALAVSETPGGVMPAPSAAVALPRAPDAVTLAAPAEDPAAAGVRSRLFGGDASPVARAGSAPVMPLQRVPADRAGAGAEQAGGGGDVVNAAFPRTPAAATAAPSTHPGKVPIAPARERDVDPRYDVANERADAFTDTPVRSGGALAQPRHPNAAAAVSPMPFATTERPHGDVVQATVARAETVSPPSDRRDLASRPISERESHANGGPDDVPLQRTAVPPAPRLPAPLPAAPGVPAPSPSLTISERDARALDRPDDVSLQRTAVAVPAAAHASAPTAPRVPAPLSNRPISERDARALDRPDDVSLQRTAAAVPAAAVPAASHVSAATAPRVPASSPSRPISERDARALDRPDDVPLQRTAAAVPVAAHVSAATAPRVPAPPPSNAAIAPAPEREIVAVKDVAAVHSDGRPSATAAPSPSRPISERDARALDRPDDVPLQRTAAAVPAASHVSAPTAPRVPAPTPSNAAIAPAPEREIVAVGDAAAVHSGGRPSATAAPSPSRPISERDARALDRPDDVPLQRTAAAVPDAAHVSAPTAPRVPAPPRPSAAIAPAPEREIVAVGDVAAGRSSSTPSAAIAAPLPRPHQTAESRGASAALGTDVPFGPPSTGSPIRAGAGRDAARPADRAADPLQRVAALGASLVLAGTAGRTRPGAARSAPPAPQPSATAAAQPSAQSSASGAPAQNRTSAAPAQSSTSAAPAQNRTSAALAHALPSVTDVTTSTPDTPREHAGVAMPDQSAAASRAAADRQLPAAARRADTRTGEAPQPPNASDRPRLQIAPTRSAPASPPPAVSSGDREREQIVRVNIGRIRVEAPASPPQPAKAPFQRPRPRLSIDEYARRRGGAP